MKLPLLLILVLSSPVVFAQQHPPLPPLVTTSGSALIRVTPDLADLYFEVEVRNSDLTLARKQQAERATKVLAALRAAGVVEAELQTSQAQIAADYTDRRQETETVKFFRVTQSITCTLHDLKKVPNIATKRAPWPSARRKRRRRRWRPNWASKRVSRTRLPKAAGIRSPWGMVSAPTSFRAVPQAIRRVTAPRRRSRRARSASPRM
jgi:hypothetical protein